MSLHYEIQGAGVPLLLLHSGGMTGAEWQPQQAVLSAQFQVITPDLPGHGRSPLMADALSISGAAQAVLALLDSLAIDRTHIVGSSLGGAIALWLALKHPERINKLVLYRVNYRKTAAGHAGTRELADPAYWRRVGMAQMLSKAHQPQGGSEAWQQVIARVAQALAPETTDHHHTLDDLAAITHSTLIVAGDRDPLVPLDDQQAMLRAIPHAGLWVIPYATHVTAVNTWRSEAFGQELLRFFLGRGVVKS